MLGGYYNKYLRVNLTTGEFKIESFPEETLRKYIGASGLGARIVYDETDEHTDPLGPDNVITFLTGPIAGTTVPNGGRYHVSTKSPVNGLLGEGSSGGSWATRLKAAGFDGVIVNGASEKPVYLHIENGTYELRDASDLWGLDTFVLDDKLKEIHGKQITVCCIGPAGENLVNCAAVMNDGVEGRAAGRCGVGAVMGSKKLKAITVKGNMKPPIAHPDELKASIKKWAPVIHNNTEGMREGGTSGGVPTVEALGDMPIRNWGAGNFDISKICGENMSKTILVKPYYCSQCVIGCGRSVHVKEGKYKSIQTGGPEYETMALFGSNLLNGDLEVVQAANEYCNRYGLDTIAAGNYVAFAMECYEHGLISKEDLCGIEAKWGDDDAIMGILELITYRKGIGDVLAEGTKKASEIIGGIAPEFSVQVKGIEFPAHDPRAADTTGLAYATSTRGACHLNAFTSDLMLPEETNGFGWMEPEKFESRFKMDDRSVNMVIVHQHAMAMMDSMSCCKFVMFGLGADYLSCFLEWMKDVVGWEMTKEEWLKTGERIFNLKRMYQVRCGVSRKDDALPPRMTMRRGTGGAADNIPSIPESLDEYYEMRGWDKLGIPTDALLEELGLEW